MTRIKTKNKTTVLSVGLICLSVLIILATTLAFFTDKKVTTNDVSFGKIEISVDDSFASTIPLTDVLPGDKITDKIAFSKSELSESMYVRAKVYFDTYSTVVEVKDLVTKLNTNSFSLVDDSTAYEWSTKLGKYYYLLDKSNTDNMYEVKDSTLITLTNGLSVPTDLTQADKYAQYFEKITLNVEIQAVQSFDVEADIINVDDRFASVFSERAIEKTLSFSLKSKDDSLVTVIPEAEKTLGEIITNNQSLQNKYNFYEDRDCKNIFSFDSTVADGSNVYVELVTEGITYTKIANSNQAVTGNSYMVGTGSQNDSYKGSVNKIILLNSYFDDGEYGLVTSIGKHAFYNNYQIKEIVIPENVESIGESAFEGCDKLEQISIPNSTKKINWYAFRECSSLLKVAFGEASELNEIGSYAFMDCWKLSTFEMPNKVVKIGEFAFNGCRTITSITLPSTLASLGNYSFSYCYALAEIYNYSNLSVSIGFNDNTGIGNYARIIYTTPSQSRIIAQNDIAYYKDSDDKYIVLTALDKNIERAELLDSTKEITRGTFNNCTALTSIAIPDSVISIGSEAFLGCYGLQNTVGDLKYIKTTTNSCYYLQGATNKALTSVSIDENCKFMGSYVFSGCGSLTSVTIPNSITNIGLESFKDCNNLTNVIYTKEVKGKYKFENGKLTIYDGAMTNSPQWYADYINPLIFEVVFNGNETGINRYAFYNCYNLKSIVIPNSVTCIGWSAFYNCKSLTSISIPNSVTSIEPSAFGGCDNLTDVTFEDANGWFVADSSTATSGTGMILTDTPQNATYLKDTYRNQYWIKKKSA